MKAPSENKKIYFAGIMRRFTQIAAFLFFLTLIMSARYPVNPSVPYNAIVKYSPFTQLFLTLRQAGTNPTTISLLVILFIFIVFGRCFCGWVCPIGTGLDIYNRFIGRRFRKKDRDVKTGNLHFKRKFFIASFVLLIAGVSLYWIIDPTSMFTRNTALVIYPIIDTTVRETSRGLSGIPDFGYQVEKTMRSFFNPIPVRSTYFWLFLFLLAFMFYLEVFAQRYFCKVLCPLGALLSYFQNFSIFKVRINESCTKCRQCVKVCKTRALEFDHGVKIDQRECILCLRCIEACNFTAMSVPLTTPVLKTSDTTFKQGRRDLINGIVSAIIVFPLFKLLDKIIPRPKHLIRPPGAIPEGKFNQVCAKCGSCMKVCYTSGIQPVMMEFGPDNVFTPRLDNVHGFCGYECNACGHVCPTGALTPLTLEIKQKVVMGIAEINREICLPWAEKKPCLTCEEVCPIFTKAVELEERPTTFDDRDDTFIFLPHVVKDNCIGCGICEHHCPTTPEKAIKVIYEDETRGGEYRQTPPVERREHFVTDEEVYWDKKKSEE
jgi:MauM/NapG family ferredoxin protein